MNITAAVLTSSSSAYTHSAQEANATSTAGVQSEALASYRNSSSTVALSFDSHDSEEWLEAYRRVSQTRTGPMLAADDSIKTIEERLSKFQKNLALSRPDLAQSGWDVTVKDGRLKVTGDISAEDKLYMEVRLNKDQSLVSAVESYMGAAKTYLETTDLNTAYYGSNGYTGQTMLYNFKDVDKQLEGKISFRDLIASSWSVYDDPNGGERGDPGNYRGGTSLEVLASQLVSRPLV